MARTKRVRVKIIKMLEEQGDLTTSDIYGQLNDRGSKYAMRHGCTKNSLNNVLGKEAIFIKIIDHHHSDAPQVVSVRGDRYRISMWGLNHPLLLLHPELKSQYANSWGLANN